MTVRELLNTMPVLKEVSFIHDNCQIETINCEAEGSWKAIKAHYAEKVFRVFAMAEDKIRIDSK